MLVTGRHGNRHKTNRISSIGPYSEPQKKTSNPSREDRTGGAAGTGYGSDMHHAQLLGAGQEALLCVERVGPCPWGRQSLKKCKALGFSSVAERSRGNLGDDWEIFGL